MRTLQRRLKARREKEMLDLMNEENQTRFIYYIKLIDQPFY